MKKKCAWVRRSGLQIELLIVSSLVGQAISYN